LASSLLAQGAHAQDSLDASKIVANATISIWALALLAVLSLAGALRR
jgi:hypothetical protein